MENTSIQAFNATIKTEGDNIFVKPVCDFFNLEYNNQVERIKVDSILSICFGKKSNSLIFGDNYQRIYLTRKGFVRWIQLINPSLIPEELQERFVKYQADIFDFMFGTAEQEIRIRELVKEDNRTEEDLAILRRQRRLVRVALRKALNDRFQLSITFNNPKPLDN